MSLKIELCMEDNYLKLYGLKVMFYPNHHQLHG